ncbi:CCA tRNA nucleotidyltransferase [Pyxidicoccus sp. MSG2]|uniref:CCA tRNA nucleotidyltransferase n=1 Tax=Pyxidicoccus sp. MSG2 TaxID=2996790 RepID=UPI00226DEAE7|nr:CCA tRNA nucleotidyltransferase [Pyxidicoccus sp. MSG2]MCY1014850.1 CCA tRNA nucleotidyltransferase [Pyxidicoccus sp. MSG2]
MSAASHAGPPSHPVDAGLVGASLAQVAYQDAGHLIRVRDVIDVLVGAGMQVYVVGGAPRDWLQGEVARDVDIAVDRSMDEVHQHLRRAFPAIDPVLSRFDRFGMMCWGAADTGGVDLSFLRAPGDIQNDDMRTTTFVPRADVREDALMRDFSVNAFYYACHEGGVLLDPLGCGLEDVSGRVLRLVTHPRVLETSYRITFRILQFLGRGYTPAPNVLAHLERYADHDIQGMGQRLAGWMASHFETGSEARAVFARRLVACAREEASRRVLEAVLSREDGSPGLPPGEPVGVERTACPRRP